MSEVRFFYTRKTRNENTEPLNIVVQTPERAAQTAATALAGSLFAIQASRPFADAYKIAIKEENSVPFAQFRTSLDNE